MCFFEWPQKFQVWQHIIFCRCLDCVSFGDKLVCDPHQFLLTCKCHIFVKKIHFEISI